MQRPLFIELLKINGNTMLHISVGEESKQLDAAGTEALIERLALLRATMGSAVPEQVSSSHRYHVEVDPCWCAQPREGGGAVLLMRHEGLGWHGFALSAQELHSFGQDLREAASLVGRSAPSAVRPH
jgi:hypothetical protein